ncbi:MAG: MBL fold metallo-hydrolase [Spirochaetales bacterium]|nr:MBL fold metallo-hydrolase [Spirochaetales bacterium]
MRIKFWGVRGSIPTPLTPTQLQSKIAAIIQRVQASDLLSPESREEFLAELPSYLLDTIGGNTTCLEVRLSDDTLIILDAGSGIRELGMTLRHRREHIRHYHLFFTHFHYDHLQGLPFFEAAFDPGSTITFYSPVKNLPEILKNHMGPPYFPVTMDVMTANLEFRHLSGTSIPISNGKVFWRSMNHPGDCYSYKIEENGKTMIFATDSELTDKDFEKTEENSDYFHEVDCLILDSQYTLDEAIEKYDWGHTSYSLGVDFATEWGIKKLALFHHDPKYDDRKISSIGKSAQWYLHHLEQKNLEIFLAREGMEIQL